MNGLIAGFDLDLAGIAPIEERNATKGSFRLTVRRLGDRDTARYQVALEMLRREVDSERWWSRVATFRAITVDEIDMQVTAWLIDARIALEGAHA